MMVHLQWFRAGGSTRGTPRGIPGPLFRLIALVGIVAPSVLLSGCRSAPYSNGCNDCGSCSKCNVSGFFSRASNRLLHRNRVYSDSVPVSEGAVEYGAPSVVVPGAIPSYPSGGSMGTSPSNVSPNNPIELEPAPSAKPSTSTGPTGSTGSGVGRSSYTTRRPAPAPATVMRSSRSLASTPDTTTDPATQPAKGSSGAMTSPSDGPSEDNFLDHLPPLGLPKEVTKSSALPPAPPSAPAGAKTGDPARSDTTTRRADAPTEAAFALTIAAEPAPETVSTAGAATGIAHFSAVDPKLAGGSRPSEAGLAWLAEKGYRTLLDLRESREVPPSFIAEVTRRGLRYVALPVDLKAIRPDLVARFNLEIGFGEARPLFFFDSDGSCAGALWYIRRVTVDRVDAQIARREAQELGLADQTAWSAATKYVEAVQSNKVDRAASRTSNADPAGASTRSAGSAIDRTASGNDPGADAAPKSFRDFLDEIKPKSEPSGPGANAAPHGAEPSVDPNRTDAGPSRAVASETMLWRPFAAMILTGLSIPLAYWTRTLVPDLVSRARASLPAPAQRPRSLPRESGA